MADKVVPLRLVEPPTKAAPSVDADLVQCVEGLVARVKAGEVTAVAIVQVYPDGGVGTSWLDPAETKFHHINSGAAALSARLNRGG